MANMYMGYLMDGPFTYYPHISALYDTVSVQNPYYGLNFPYSFIWDGAEFISDSIFFEVNNNKFDCFFNFYYLKNTTSYVFSYYYIFNDLTCIPFIVLNVGIESLFSSLPDLYIIMLVDLLMKIFFLKELFYV